VASINVGDSSKGYVTTLHWYCTAEYTLTFKPAGTESSVVVLTLQGAIVSVPNASIPISATDRGSVMDSSALQS
jgi:hypothetical protein